MIKPIPASTSISMPISVLPDELSTNREGRTNPTATPIIVAAVPTLVAIARYLVTYTIWAKPLESEFRWCIH